MKSHLPCRLAVILAIFSIGPNSVIAQSTSVQGPLPTGSAYVTTGSGPSLIPWERIPVTRTSTMRRMEKILAEGGPPLDSEMTAKDLLAKLQAFGLPVVLDETAIDDDVDEDTVIQLELPDHALGLRLELALAKRGACIQLYHDHAKIISRDNMDDPEYFVTLTYDVSSMVSWEDRFVFANTIRQSVNSDGWTQTGTGDQTMAFSIGGGRNLLTISAPWSGHVHVRQLLAQMTTLSSIIPGRIASRKTASSQQNRLTASTPVELPMTNVGSAPVRFTRPATTSLEGGGLPGGAFSIPGG